EPRGRGHRAKLAGIGHDHWRSSAALRGHPVNVANPSCAVHVVATGADTNNVVGRADVDASEITQGDVGVAGRVELKRTNTDSRVDETNGVVQQSKLTYRCVEVAGGVLKERSIADGRIALASGIAIERIRAEGGVS